MPTLNHQSVVFGGETGVNFILPALGRVGSCRITHVPQLCCPRCPHCTPAQTSPSLPLPASVSPKPCITPWQSPAHSRCDNPQGIGGMGCCPPLSPHTQCCSQQGPHATPIQYFCCVREKGKHIPVHQCRRTCAAHGKNHRVMES